MKRLLFLAALPLLFGCAAQRSDAGKADEPRPGIARVWTGRVPDARADEYETYLRTGIAKFPTIQNNLGNQMMRRDLPDESTEFVVISYWPDLASIRAYAGDDIDKVRDLPRDHEFLVNPERTVRHYEIKELVR